MRLTSFVCSMMIVMASTTTSPVDGVAIDQVQQMPIELAQDDKMAKVRRVFHALDSDCFQQIHALKVEAKLEWKAVVAEKNTEDPNTDRKNALRLLIRESKYKKAKKWLAALKLKPPA